MTKIELLVFDNYQNKMNPFSELSKSRMNLKSNTFRKRILARVMKEKSGLKNGQIVQLRENALLIFQIDFLPLCCDEDWEIIAAALTKNNLNYSERIAKKIIPK